MDELPAGKRLLELGAQLVDVDVDGAIAIAKGVAPHYDRELVAADDARRTARERDQQPMLSDRQVERASRSQDERIGVPNLELAGPDYPMGVFTVRGLHDSQPRSLAVNSRYRLVKEM